MDPFAVIILGGTGGGVVALYLLGRLYPGDGTEQIRWGQARSEEQRISDDIDDLNQMLEAANARRRAKGRPELTEESVHAEVAARRAGIERDAKRDSDDDQLDVELTQMLEVTNARRARKGEPPLTLEEYRAHLEGKRP